MQISDYVDVNWDMGGSICEGFGLGLFVELLKTFK